MTVLDTNVISEMMLPLPSGKVRQWISAHPTQQLFTTTVSLAEILYGIEILPLGKRRSSLLGAAETMFASLFAQRILGFDVLAARSFPQIAASRRLQVRPMSVLDTQIAAIANANGATLATRNTADFADCGVRLVNPWE